MFFSFRECLLNIRRSWGIAAVSVIIIALSLLMFGMFGVITFNVVQAIHLVREKVDMEVYLRDGIGDVARYQVQTRLEGLEGAGEVVYVSKQDALAEGRVREEYLAVLEDNPLPASYRISFNEGFRTVAYLENVADILGEYPEIDEVVYGLEWIRILDKITQTFVVVVVTLGLFILFAAGFVIAYTTRLAYYARRDDVDIMQLVGATRSVVRRPFVLEGILLGGIGGGLAMGILYGGLRLLNPYLFIGLVMPSVRLLSLLVLMGVLLGYMGSTFSIRTHVK